METTHHNHPDRPVVVLGGTGKTGRRVAAQLTDRGIPVRIGSRHAETRFDWDDASTWPAVLDGAGKAYISYQPDLTFPGALDRIGRFAELAVQAGVGHLVLLSGRGEPAAKAAEDVVHDAGVDSTILRCSWFNQNFDEDFLVEPVREGVLAVPAGSVAEPFVDADDIADVAVAALTEPGHAGELYELTGPHLLTFADVAAELSAATGRLVTYVPIADDEFGATLRAAGLPEEHVDGLHHLFVELLDGRNESLADGVRRALGREPRDFASFARTAAATGVWNTTGEADR